MNVLKILIDYIKKSIKHKPTSYTKNIGYYLKKDKKC